MALYEFNQKRPLVDKSSWIAPSAQIIGDVRIGKTCWIGPNAVIRGDLGPIVIGEGTAVEDGVVIHTPSQIQIGSMVTIGHMAMVHGSSVGDYAVIGMNSTLGDNSVVGSWSIIAEHSLVKKNQIVPDYKLFGGCPAVEIGAIEQRHKDYMVLGKQIYAELTRQYHSTLKKIS